MRKIWVFLLAVVVFGLGAFGAVAYTALAGSFGSFRIACELLNTAESSGMLQKAQRADVVDRVAKKLQEHASGGDAKGRDAVLRQLTTGCPKL